MLDDVKEINKNCEACQRNEKIKQVFEHPARTIKVIGINNMIGIDMISGLPETTEGFKCICTITEYSTKNAEAYPTKSKSADEIVYCLILYFSIYGPAKVILSDQGKEFNNELVNKLLSANGIEHKVTSAYNPRTNGQTERFNDVLIESLRKHCEKNTLSWPKCFIYFNVHRSRVIF